MHNLFTPLRMSFILLLIASCFSCSKSTPATTNTIIPPPVNTYVFAKGADVSWVTQMESSSIKFYDSTGTNRDLFTILNGVGMNTIRLRVWVNPTGGWNGQADVVAKAVRAKNAGMRVMIDFHYSDSWADPGQQNKPAAWATEDINGLKTSVADHTTTVLNALKAAGVTPEWVQVGNETDNGMLWPEGNATSSMSNFAQLESAGYDAVKAVFPSTKVIVHISNGFNNSLFRWMFDGLVANNGKFDVIGMSLYPSTSNWATLNSQCLANMNDMVSRYGREVMIVETGMSWDQPAIANAFLSDLISKVKSLPNNKGLGVLYWEPEAYNGWQGYTLGAFDNSGKPTAALNAFK